ncbi:MAG: hypothetical protein ACRDZ9_01460 [Acidimicrobiales bacterium]
MPALCVLFLVGAGLALVLLPVKVEERSCGSPLAVVARSERPTPFSRECHEKAVKDVAFGAVIVVVGVAAGVVSAGVLRSDHPAAGPGSEGRPAGA